MSSNVFKHSGDLGDIIYALPTIRKLGGGTLMLDRDEKNRTIREIMTPNKAKSLGALLERQPYIEHVGIRDRHPDIEITHDFDDFRKLLNPGMSLLEAQGILFDVEHKGVAPWLSVEKVKVSPIIFARSARYQTVNKANFNWNRLYRLHHLDAVFVGTHEEHNRFCTEIGAVSYFETPTLLDLAQIIAGSDLFICNQSCPLAIGFGVGAQMIVEEYEPRKDCHIPRANVKFGFTLTDGVK